MTALLNLITSHWSKSLLVITLVTLGTSACKQILDSDYTVVRFADKNSYMVTDDALRRVDRTFYAAFQLGEWRYTGANARSGQVNAFIQMPQRLALSNAVQQQYIQQVLCPGEDNLELWHQLKNVDLQLHIYTQSKQKTVSATCLNPLQV